MQTPPAHPPPCTRPSPFITRVICSAPAALISSVTFITELHTPLCSPRYSGRITFAIPYWQIPTPLYHPPLPFPTHPPPLSIPYGACRLHTTLQLAGIFGSELRLEPYISIRLRCSRQNLDCMHPHPPTSSHTDERTGP